MVTTSDHAVWARMWAHKDHGKSWEAVYEREHPPGFRWLHESFGTNWRMTEMQAAIGRIQLMRMSDWTKSRARNAKAITEALAPFGDDNGPVRVPSLHCTGCNGCDTHNCCVHAYYKYYTYVRPKNLAPGWDRDRIVEEIKALGVPCFQGSCSEVYLERSFEDTGWRPKERLQVAKELGETSLMFLVHPTLTDSEITKTTEALQEVLEQARRS